jgi:DNA-binding response OmpR family regulator
MKKILIIHGQVNIREYLADKLAAEGYLVVPIGRSALAKEVISTLSPDLILLNLDNDKYALLEELKQLSPPLPILVTTWRGSGKDLCCSLDDVYVIKGLDFDGLEKKVAAVLQWQTVNFKEHVKSNNLQI